MVGLHPGLSSGAPELVVQATTGKATATSPVSGAVVVVDVVFPVDWGTGGVVDAEPMIELPQPDTSAPADSSTAPTAQSLATLPIAGTSGADGAASVGNSLSSPARR